MWIGYTLAKTIFTKLHLSEKINIFFPNFENFFVKFSEMIRDKFIFSRWKLLYINISDIMPFIIPLENVPPQKRLQEWWCLMFYLVCIYSRVDDMLVTKSSPIDFASNIHHRHRCSPQKPKFSKTRLTWLEFQRMSMHPRYKPQHVLITIVIPRIKKRRRRYKL